MRDDPTVTGGLDVRQVLGAEFTGTVTAVGDQVTSVAAGDLVTALLQYSCETCERCQNWRPDL